MRTKKVLFVGGGSAGWTAAAYLNAALNTGGQKVAEISLVESPDVPRIGVGEATIPNINRTLAMIGIDELEFMRAVDATFKTSIRFVNWLDEQRRFYHHPFSRFAAGLRDDAGRRRQRELGLPRYTARSAGHARVDHPRRATAHLPRENPRSTRTSRRVHRG